VLEGPFEFRTIVSQGCRPIGRPLIVTKAEANAIQELGRRPALEVLQDLYQALSDEDQQRVQQGLHLGRVVNEYQESFGRGDFLVRNVIAIDDDGAIRVSDAIRIGQTIQFHVRDAATADEDLRSLLENDRRAHPGTEPLGALLFDCNGRGTRLFDRADHDVVAIRDALGPIPVAGFFAMGEVGPVASRHFVHGYTACLLVIERSRPSS
jgi:small ligand-binding sensory domain FIST